MHISRARLVPAILLLACAACADSSGRSVTLLHYDAVVPADWSAGEPGSEMRLAEFDAGDGAEIVVFYFGPGQGGSVEANVTRWEGQFTDADGGPVSADVTELDDVAFSTTVASLEGTYSRGIGMGALTPGEPQSGHALIAAVVETPEGSLFPQLFGPTSAVEAEREAFLAFLKSLDTGDA